MIQTDFAILYRQTIKLASALIERPFDDSFLENFDIYSNSMDQFIQILGNMPEKSESVKLQIKNLLDTHKKVEKKLIQGKEIISGKINRTIRKEHIRQKYFTKNIESALLNKKI